MTFDDIIGQKPVVDRLRKYAGGEMLSHSYLFCGPKGIGKRTVADIFAKAVLCSEPKSSGGCGLCHSCVAFDSGTSPDFVRISVQEGSIGVDLARYLQGQAVSKPVYSDFKVFIIEDAERMTEQAQNCLLKMFEEPPSGSVHILTVSYYEALLPTLRSRMTRVDFKSNSIGEVMQYLRTAFKAPDDSLWQAAQFADGIIGTAVDALSTAHFTELREKAWEAVMSIYGADLTKALKVTAFFESNKERADLVFDIMESFVRDMMLVSFGIDASRLINRDKQVIIFDIARKTPGSKFVRDMETLCLARRDLKFNINFPLAVDSMILKIQEVRDKWSA